MTNQLTEEEAQELMRELIKEYLIKPTGDY